MITYTNGLHLKAERNVTKNDIITLCMRLNSKYSDSCEFEPEGITEGGIVFKWPTSPSCYEAGAAPITSLEGCVGPPPRAVVPYKTVRFSNGNGRIKWCWINNNVMSEWTNNSDIVFVKNEKINTFLKSLFGAPLFTIDELKSWEECFNTIGIVSVGKYPTQKSLKTIQD